MPTILDRIVETKRREVSAARQAVPLADLAAAARDADRPRDFHAALSAPARHGVHLIAEIKKASPSAGLIRTDFDPASLARQYYQAGASALSVLTDETYFQGRLDHILQVKEATPLPVLRKDFIIDGYQVHEARRHGADAVLLIAEVLNTDTIRRFADLIAELGMAALIEVHGPERLEAVMAAVDFDPAHRRLLGINNRDLAAQVTDVATTGRLTARLESKPLLISESGIGTRADVERVVADGADAILVGEALLRHDDPTDKIRELLGASV